MSELTNFEKQLAENWENAEQVIYDNEQRITALEAELAAANARADQLAAALEWIKTKTEVHRLHGGKHTDYVHALRLIEDKADAALAAHHADRPGA